MRSLAEAMSDGIVVLDGGLATELERRGNDLSSSLWSAGLLAEAPDEIVAAHRAYFRAGAQVATTATYQASFEGFATLGIDDDEAIVLMRRSVALAARARDEVTREDAGGVGPERWVAASIGPFGAMLADGSEYRGDYGRSVTELRVFHRHRLEVLAASGADVLAIETIPCAVEVEALVLELALLDIPAWISLTCSGLRTRAGEPAEEVFSMAASAPTVIAVGINCTDPGDAEALVGLASQTGKPVVVYPNSGEWWNAGARGWEGEAAFSVADVRGWITAGARLVGGCCRVGPTEIAALARAAVVSGQD